MDIDPNDLLSTNQFIAEPQLIDQNPELGEEFRRYYEKDIQEKERQQIVDDLKNFKLDDTFDDNILTNTNAINNKNNDNSDTKIIQKTLKTLVSIDSRDRNQFIYKKPNHFKIFLGKTFTNVKTVKLVSIEFPNTDAVINSKNNIITWRNIEDIVLNNIDTNTGTYPVYRADLRIGSYNLRSLQSEINNKLGIIKRQQGAGDFHYFDVKLDSDTDIVSYTSLILIQLDNNPIDLTKGVNIVTVDYPPDKPHDYENGDLIYIIGAKTVGGLPASLLNTSHRIRVVSRFQITFEVTVKASESVKGGGNSIRTGKLAPFQLLFGETNNTVAPNLGFPLENSSQRVDIFINKIETIYLVQVILDDPHNFENTYDYVGKTCLISGTTDTNGGTIEIVGIPNSNTLIIVSPNNIEITPQDDTTGILQFILSGVTLSFPIKSVKNFQQNTTRINTYTPHRFFIHDTGRTVAFYNTTSVPPIDGDKRILFIPSNFNFIIAQKIFKNVGGVEPVGSFPVLDPIKTTIKEITGITISNYGINNKLLVSSPNHGLSAGDSIKLYNVKTIPDIEKLLNNTFVINTIPSLDEFIIDFNANSISTINPFFGIDVYEMTFPNHGFNFIANMENSILVEPKTNQTVGVKKVTTMFEHGFKDESNFENDIITDTFGNTIVTKSKYEKQTQYIRFNKTGISEYDELFTNTNFKINYIDKDEFHIYQIVNSGTTVGNIISTRGSLLSNATTGILGLSDSFYLYNVDNIGNISANDINNKLLNLKNIIDVNTFTFTIPGVFSDININGGGSNVYINSLKHGFNGIQDNTKNTILNRSINLEGENYSFLCSPQLSTMMNTGQVQDVFARITLDQSPGAVVFSYLSNPKDFDPNLLPQLDQLEFFVRNYDNTLYEFNDLDFSFTLEITEVLDTSDNFNTNSRMIPQNIKTI